MVAQLAGPARETDVAVRGSGPVVKDRLWYALVGESPWSRDGRRSLVGAGKLTWQVNGRNKVKLLALEEEADRALLGLTWESLVTDRFVAKVQAGHRRRECGVAAWQGDLRLEWYSGDNAPDGRRPPGDGRRRALERPPLAGLPRGQLAPGPQPDLDPALAYVAGRFGGEA